MVKWYGEIRNDGCDFLLEIHEKKKGVELTTEKRDAKYGKELKTDFVKIGDPDSQEAKDSDYKYVNHVNGVLLEIGRMNMSGGPVGRYKLEQESGDAISFLGTTILDDKLSLAEVGQDVWVGFVGTEKSKTTGHSPTKLFEVFIAE